MFWYHLHHCGLHRWLSGKESVNAGDMGDAGSIPGSDNPLEKEMATHSSVLSWEPLERGPWQGPRGCKVSDTT